MPFRPQADIRELKDRYAISLEAPGVDQKDIDIQLLDDTLVIRGEKKRKTEEKEGRRIEIKNTLH